MCATILHACLPVDPIPDDCADSIVMSDCPNITHESKIPVSVQVQSPLPWLSTLAVSSISRAECYNNFSHLHAISSSTVDRESLLSSSSLPSSATSSGAYEAVIPLNLKDLICFIFDNLQLACCNLHSSYGCIIFWFSEGYLFTLSGL